MQQPVHFLWQCALENHKEVFHGLYKQRKQFSGERQKKPITHTYTYTHSKITAGGVQIITGHYHFHILPSVPPRDQMVYFNSFGAKLTWEILVETGGKLFCNLKIWVALEMWSLSFYLNFCLHIAVKTARHRCVRSANTASLGEKEFNQRRRTFLRSGHQNLAPDSSCAISISEQHINCVQCMDFVRHKLSVLTTFHTRDRGSTPPVLNFITPLYCVPHETVPNYSK